MNVDLENLLAATVHLPWQDSTDVARRSAVQEMWNMSPDRGTLLQDAVLQQPMHV